jgi:hypothetical protein
MSTRRGRTSCGHLSCLCKSTVEQWASIMCLMIKEGIKRVGIRAPVRPCVDGLPQFRANVRMPRIAKQSVRSNRLPDADLGGSDGADASKFVMFAPDSSPFVVLFAVQIKEIHRPNAADRRVSL